MYPILSIPKILGFGFDFCFHFVTNSDVAQGLLLSLHPEHNAGLGSLHMVPGIKPG